MSENVSVPRAVRAPRPLSQDEQTVLALVADVLVPGRDDTPAASAEPGFWDAVAVALDARADAFGDITALLEELSSTGQDQLWDRLRSLDADRPAEFQALSTVIAGAWLLTPGVRDRIAYQGQRSDKAGLDEAADEISSGVLDPVLERSHQEGPRWIR
jgi:hypothetical protein